MDMLWNGKSLAELPFKCKYCGKVGQIYPMHYCDTIKGMRDIEDNLMRDTIPLTVEEQKDWDLIHNPTLFQKIIGFFKNM